MNRRSCYSMRFIFTLLLCSLLFACSSTKIHLYTRYLSVADVDKITRTLEEHDFDVVPNTLKYPDDIVQSTLLYSPFMEGEDRANELINTLDRLGWVIASVQPLFMGNHYYAKNSAGLLLLPDGVIPSDKVAIQDLVNDYETKDCQEKVTLRLNKDNTYQVFYPTS
jgi:hypothetical protein